MSKHKTDEFEYTQDEAGTLAEESAQEPAKTSSYFFPNIREGQPFAGMFASQEEADDANNHHLHKGDK